MIRQIKTYRSEGLSGGSLPSAEGMKEGNRERLVAFLYVEGLGNVPHY